MLRLFLSHASADLYAADRICVALQSPRTRVFMSLRHTPFGVSILESVAHEIDTADAVVVAWSNAAERRPWVFKEITHAKERSKYIIPVILEKDAPPFPSLAADVRSVPFYLNPADALERLRHRIVALVQIKEAREQAEARARTGWAVALVAIAALGICAHAFEREADEDEDE